jgi:hypothetical protein
MKNFVKTLMTAVVLAALAVVFASPAHAQSATQNNSVTVNCSTGAYGQGVNCPVTTNQSITQNVNLHRQNLYHDVSKVNTGMDSNTFTATVVTLITTTSGAVITLKSKLSK